MYNFWGSLQSQKPNAPTNLSRRPERVLRGNVLDVVGERVVGQDVVGLVDAVHGVLEGELRRRVLLVIFGRQRKQEKRLDGGIARAFTPRRLHEGT